MFPEFHKRKTEPMENGKYHLLAGNGTQKRQIAVCFLQMETENGNLFSLVGKQ
jgi:hypothetical protein